MMEESEYKDLLKVNEKNKNLDFSSEDIKKEDYNTDEIYRATLKQLYKTFILVREKNEIVGIKDKMMDYAKEISKVYDLIFKGFTDNRILIYKVPIDVDNSYEKKIYALNSSGIGIANLYQKDDYEKMKIGEDVVIGNVRLNTINRADELIIIMKHIAKNYQSIIDTITNATFIDEGVTRKCLSEMKLNRFKRFFSKMIDHEVMNLPEVWTEFTTNLANYIDYLYVDEGEIKVKRFNNIEFSQGLTGMEENVSLSSDNKEDNEKNKSRSYGYGYRRGETVRFTNLQEISPIFKEVHSAIIEYKKVLEAREKIMLKFKDSIKEEFAKELVYAALTTGDTKDDE